ncbi:hypothetical protein [Desulfoplanes sp.]
MDNFKTLLAAEKTDTLIIGDDEGQVELLTTQILDARSSVGILGTMFPLLSNLSILENIVLGAMYRENLPMQTVTARIYDDIGSLGLVPILELRKESLEKREVVLCQLLRGLCDGNTTIFLPSPPIRTVDTIVWANAVLNRRFTVWIATTRQSAVAYDHFGFPTFRLGG